MSGPDVAGIYAALAKAPGRSRSQRAADRAAGATTRTAAAMAAGRRYRTRSLPGPRRYVNPVFHAQPRCDRGHFLGPNYYDGCKACPRSAA